MSLYVQASILFPLAVLLYPPARRRLHRFVDAKLAPLHQSHAAIHAKLDALAPASNPKDPMPSSDLPQPIPVKAFATNWQALLLALNPEMAGDYEVVAATDAIRAALNPPKETHRP